ncbi:MAG TPA: DNA replication/repair protein RecF [Clostridiales bacterium]|nr:MAG: hypothetical protein A2Y22_00490 [Clostridiales bacterium GWD2_32_59]HAN09094.1 DNA replication/repair protein RecF [Clostridiales bacterium]
MYINNLKLENFRNYKTLDINLDKGLNVFIGNNAQGKTNLLESIYILAMGKSYKEHKDLELINWNNEELYIKTILSKKDREEHINIYINKNKKKTISINELYINKLTKLIGIINIVIFTPDDLLFFKNGPDVRRQYFDAQISQIDRMYFENIQKYYKIVKNRNNLLKNKNVSRETLYPWDIQLLQYGKEIIRKRNEYIKDLQDIIFDIHKSLTSNVENIELIYNKNVKEENFENELTNSFETEKKYGYTIVGPHKDDYNFTINNRDLKKYGSQGQQRTSILSLKFSEIELIKNETGENPILLLDDVLSELDIERQKHLIKYIQKVQTILTTTEFDEKIMHDLNIGKIFNIKEGKIV